MKVIQKPNHLITMPISHYCEKARWALEWTGIPYSEERHLQGFHFWPVYRVKKTDSVPLLITEKGVYTDSTDILKWCDVEALAHRKIYPTDPGLCATVDAFEDELDEGLGNSGRLWMYSYLINDLALLLRYSKIHEVPSHEIKLMPFLYPFMKSASKKMLNMGPNSRAESLEDVNQIFRRVENLLSDGRAFLYGEQFSAADLTFAALAASILIPEQYGVSLPSLEEVPIEMAEQIRKWRNTVAGKFAMKMYSDYRRPKINPLS